MDFDTRKNLASNWFKSLQDSFCEDIKKLFVKILKNSKINEFNLNQHLGKKILLEMKVEVSIESYKMEKFLKKLE